MNDAPDSNEGAVVCAADLQCDDHVFCNGVERCMPGATTANASGCVAANPASPCGAGQMCNEATDSCETPCDVQGDLDGDGHRAMNCGGDDCDDNDANRFPGNAEHCDSAHHDEDCDPCTVSGTDGDTDSDLYRSSSCCDAWRNAAPTCDASVAVDAAAMLVCGTDCNDADANVHPNQVEACNGADDNCNGQSDEGVMATYYPDCDGDGFGGLPGVSACSAPVTTPPACPGSPWVTVGGDCSDMQPAVNPSTATRDVCDGIDNDCDGTVDGSSADAWCNEAPQLSALNATAATCSAGACRVSSCASGSMVCGARCMDVQSDPANCGSCAHACAAGVLCVMGSCSSSCVPGLTYCSGRCVDTDSDRDNCGSCGNSCFALDCRGGTCS
jgi:hypothetical protein